ncbi:rhodanese-like domain-containing protein [Eisenibacter elegans]|jgi:rhodanese-related sulfurtransferase|uniref:rhodanese-like domain-containing protein n=1 Tax=Eisenibacter elegans TaxID=997 RepID=UPI00041CFAE2|nr:rhodanese-like domain-containing protein [Eisenibacter elegans]
MDITPEELQERLAKGEALHIVDVREPFEYEDDNLEGILIPLGNIGDRWEELAELKEAEIIIHCRSGRRSETAQKFLQSKGFANVRNLIGGIEAYRSL